MKVKISICVVCTALLVLLSGCGKSDEERVQKYLEDRYNEEFVVIDTESSSYGGAAFSYNLSASCYPTAHPEYIFYAEISHAGTSEASYSDHYAQGILNKRTADIVSEKLADFPSEFCVFVNVNNKSDVKFDNMEEVDYESYFLNSYRNYSSYTNQLYPIVYSIAINEDSYESIGFDKEFELFYGILKEMSADIQADGKLNIRFMPQELYNRYTTWYSEHTINSFGMPTNYYYADYDFGGEFIYELYELHYSLQNDKLTSFNSSKETMTEELYVNKRMANQYKYEK